MSAFASSARPVGRGSRPSRGSDYAELSRLIKQAALLERCPVYYTLLIGITAALFVAGWTVFALLGDSWWQLTVAVFLAVIFTQVGFIGHEAGHRQILRSRRANDLIGLLAGNLAIGMSYGWWVGKHNRHHAHPNQEGYDPDITIGGLAFTAEQARGRRGPARVWARYQGYAFFPLFLLVAVDLRVSSVQALLRRGLRHRWWEALLLAVHVVGYVTAVLLVLSPLRAVVFIAVQQGLFGLYLGCAFAPNHKGMPILSEHDELDFLRRQVLTSRNVRGGPIVDVALGGLNYQIEHHLFPTMPRPNLRRAQPVVRAFCAERGVSYLESSLLGSYAHTVGHFHQVGRHARRAANE
jgi:fatty acid desaturase